MEENLLSPPQAPSEEEARADLNALVACNPALHDASLTRWTLKNLLIAVQKKGYQVNTQGSLHQLLSRLGLRKIQARYEYKSPDPFYQEKLDYIESIKIRVKESNGREIILYLDECNYYRQPLLAPCWTRSEEKQEKAKRSKRSDTRTRILGAINAQNGGILTFQAPKISVSDHASFYKKVRDTYPQAEKIWVIQDNNPVHFHPNLLVALEKQESRFPMTLAPNWPEKPKEWAIKRFHHWNLPIQIVQIPTYAPWCNPIEKVWKYFRQHFLHMHGFSDDLELLRAKTQQFFDRLLQGSAELLRYVGLRVPY